MVSPLAENDTQKNVRIMVVEDVDFNLEILTAILAERGWQAVTATSGEAALEILAADCDFQIILMDIGLPGIDGLETTRRLKEKPACRAIPVIALTADSATERKRFLAAGFDGYAEKDFDPDQLFAAIETHLAPAGGTRRKPAPAVTPPSTLLDLDFEALLATYGDETLLCRIAKAFFADTNTELQRLDKAMASGDRAGILACCHSLRGSAAIFTAKKLATVSKELEDCIRQGNKTGIEPAWHRVVAAHDLLREIVTHRLTMTWNNQ
ncbi:MAG: response regulator [Desulfobulbia bacterium]